MSGDPPAPVGAGDWERRVAASPLPVLVDFHAPWCAPCRPVTALCADLAREHAGRLEVVAVDVDAEPALAARWEILSLPTVIVFRSGDPVARLDGRIRRGRLDAALAPFLHRE